MHFRQPHRLSFQYKNVWKGITSQAITFRLFSLFLVILFHAGFSSLTYSASNKEEGGSGAGSPRKKIVYGGDYRYLPFEYLDENNQPAGFHIDLIRYIAEQNNWDVEFRLGPWDESLKAFREGQSDIMAAFRSPYRELFLAFANPHAIVFHKIFTRQGSQEIINLNELQGKSVVVQKDAYVHDFLRDYYPNNEIIPVASEQDALLLLSTGAYDCAIVSRIAGNLSIRRLGIKNLVSASPVILPIEYCFGVHHDDSLLLKTLNEGLTKAKLNGVYDRIEQQWLAPHRQSQSNLLENLKKVMWVIAILVFIILLVFSWGWSLRSQVAKRTQEITRELEVRHRVENALAQREKKLSSILRAAPMGIGVVNDRTITDVNDVVCKITGYTRQELLGKSARMLYPTEEEFIRVGELKYREIKRSGIGSIETVWVKKDGTQCDVLLSSSPIDDSDLSKGVTFIVVDISRMPVRVNPD